MTSSTSNPEPLRPIDRAWLRMDEPDNLMIITGVMLFDSMDLATLRAVIERRLLRVERFRQRVVRQRGVDHWEDDPTFDIANHVLPLALPKPADQRALQAVVGDIMSQPLPADRPLWRFWMVEDYKGGNVLISRLHHAIGDGVALMMVLLSLTDLTPEAAAVGRAETEEDSPFASLFHASAEIRHRAADRAAEIMPEVVSLMRRSGAAMSKARSTAAMKLSTALGRLVLRPPDTRTLFKGPLQVAKCVTWSDEISLDEIKAIKDRIGGTVNDVLLTAMTGGLRRYLLHRGQAVPAGLGVRAAVPVSLRKIDQLADMGNRFGLVFVRLPVGIAEPRARLAELRRRMEALKGSYEAGVVLGFLHGMGRSPLVIQRLIERIFGLKATAVMTNVPGPRQPLYLSGRRIRDMLFWVPQSGRLGLGISILSYAGSVRLGVATDWGLIPDPEVIIEGFHAEVEALRAL